MLPINPEYNTFRMTADTVQALKEFLRCSGFLVPTTFEEEARGLSFVIDTPVTEAVTLDLACMGITVSPSHLRDRRIAVAVDLEDLRSQQARIVYLELGDFYIDLNAFPTHLADSRNGMVGASALRLRFVNDWPQAESSTEVEAASDEQEATPSEGLTLRESYDSQFTLVGRCGSAEEALSMAALLSSAIRYVRRKSVVSVIPRSYANDDDDFRRLELSSFLTYHTGHIPDLPAADALIVVASLETDLSFIDGRYGDYSTTICIRY